MWANSRSIYLWDVRLTDYCIASIEVNGAAQLLQSFALTRARGTIINRDRLATLGFNASFRINTWCIASYC
jgi:hypothetical protein